MWMRSLKFPENQQPTYLFTAAGVSFFEHPTLGDESPLLVKSPYTGAFLETGFYDTPDFFEVMDLIPKLPGIWIGKTNYGYSSPAESLHAERKERHVPNR